MIRVKVVGATGYGGVGITELLLRHPEVKLVSLIAREAVGQKINEVYPHLDGFCDLPVLAADDPAAQEPVDVVFYSTPDRVGMYQAPDDLAKGAKVIDYSGDFRFTSEEAYADYATRIGKDPVHASPQLLGKNVYGLAELHRADIRKADLVGNPGCFACSCILGMAAAAKEKMILPHSVICDCKSGVSGAGKKPKPGFHYPARYENMNAYRLSGHQHVCEVERELSQQAGEDIKITFTAQVVPVCRGILSTLYADLRAPMSEGEVLELYRSFYRDSPFVRIYPSNTDMSTQYVRGTNYCNLVVSVDSRVNRLRIVAHIDNLMKGQAGSALQNMNLMFGLPENTGLDHAGVYP
ncbi:MAG: N-acetyl-gamma-glutamyl-phosphate reductase [Kiritimatiellae bacterium]|nr:N-acetyl-gamma-glutamyl-phosphate reductase [Kiritimatiellia bacterium]